MEFWWLLGGAVLVVAVLFMRNKDRMPWRTEKPKERLGPSRDVDRVKGDQAELWPDRTGPQTKKELGARPPAQEAKRSPGASPAKEQSQAEYLTWQYVTPHAHADKPGPDHDIPEGGENRPSDSRP